MPTSQSRHAHGGHANHAHYCACGRVVHGNGGKQHFREGHRRITRDQWEAMHRWDPERGWVPIAQVSVRRPP